MSKRRSKRQSYDLNNMIQDCEYIGKENGLDVYIPKQKIHIQDATNRIKIVHVGRENNLPVKTILLVGETGNGKTTLLNALYNHFCSIKFEDNHRMRLFAKEESCESKESYESQTETLTGYLFYTGSFMRYNFNVMIIDTPGLNDTRGFTQQEYIMNQMNTFLKDEKYGIIDLHCLAFVVKATFNRCLEYFGKILDECMRSFGKDTENITYILKTFAVDKGNSISKLFEDKWGIKTKNEFNFDNGTLYESNEVGGMDYQGNTEMKPVIEMRRIRWNIQSQECETFFGVLSLTAPVSLRLTRAVLKEKQYLEHAKANLFDKTESTLLYFAAGRKNKKMLAEYKKSMDENKAWRGEETKIVRTYVPISNDARWYQFFPHVHNCKNCDKTCSYICHIWISCPPKTSNCVVCNCESHSHEKESQIIHETISVQEVTDKDMKARDDVDVKVVNDEENMLKEAIATMVKHICLQQERLNELSVVFTTQSHSEILDEVIENSMYLAKNIDEHCTDFLQAVVEEVEKLKIDKENWLKEHSQRLPEGNMSTYKAVTKALYRTASNAVSQLVFSSEKNKK